ncbi:MULTISPECIES: hypothetical protein [unclassified Nodularia (in: cyanobacteria)]|nr:MULTISPECIES: hypothetical protein [unclassified Nodularia (in: cyanobacteria)]MBE9198646.1 hypothetical protein [Nodularia sp. LEGE 06071]MCC2691784.1 hypothetical protein [Nodularia sp. LEGE 04288]
MMLRPPEAIAIYYWPEIYGFSETKRKTYDLNLKLLSRSMYSDRKFVQI